MYETENPYEVLFMNWVDVMGTKCDTLEVNKLYDAFANKIEEADKSNKAFDIISDALRNARLQAFTAGIEIGRKMAKMEVKA